MPPAAGKAQVFADKDYQGASATLEEGCYNFGLNTGAVGNDVISSLKVAAGYEVTLYADYNGEGASKTYTSDTPWLEGFNDTASSIQIAAAGKTGEWSQGSGSSAETGDDWFYFEDTSSA
ncbi:hypothetical protein [Actinomadura gamaensis]|uniref:Beta/gamma crystallin 'Greek key' domain-containing protein n=1 Tax=Actinomadura gamaensis TaxID=1763541 RepID=A0ABV9U2V6_9ACTN